jgi:hypothetical protein
MALFIAIKAVKVVVNSIEGFFVYVEAKKKKKQRLVEEWKEACLVAPAGVDVDAGEVDDDGFTEIAKREQLRHPVAIEGGRNAAAPLRPAIPLPLQGAAEAAAAVAGAIEAESWNGQMEGSVLLNNDDDNLSEASELDEADMNLFELAALESSRAALVPPAYSYHDDNNALSASLLQSIDFDVDKNDDLQRSQTLVAAANAAVVNEAVAAPPAYAAPSSPPMPQYAAPSSPVFAFADNPLQDALRDLPMPAKKKVLEAPEVVHTRALQPAGDVLSSGTRRGCTQLLNDTCRKRQ